MVPVSLAMAIKIVQFPALRDNYGFLVHDPTTGATASIDAPEVRPIVKALKENDWTLTHICSTHHHHDHVGGNSELRKLYPGVVVVGPRAETHKFDIDVPVAHGDTVKVGDVTFQVIDVGGHTLGHVAYYSPDNKCAFVGDSLFVMGCGRMFEGTYEQNTESLKRLKALPDDTVLYCAHEYTQANGKFAISVEPNNPDLSARIRDVAEKRKQGLPTVPTTLQLEKLTNPFLRFDQLRIALELPADADDVSVFAAVRKAKDKF